jgi:hypothetical protein
VRPLLAVLLGIVAVAAGIASGATAVLTRTVVDPVGFTETVVRTIQSPAGLALVEARTADAVAGESSGLLEAGVATLAGRWAAEALASDAAVRVIAPAALGLQQGILNGTQTGEAQVDVRALADAVRPPEPIALLLRAVPGELLVDVPWIRVSPEFERLLRELDRHPAIPTVLAVAAVLAAAAAVALARRRGLALLLIGLALAAGALALRPAVDAYASLVVTAGGDPARGGLAEAAADQVLRGWPAVSGALVAIGLAFALVGLVAGLRRPRRPA